MSLFDSEPVRSAVLSECGTYRYRLGRVWKPDVPVAGWVMLNPSTADADQDDPTIRRCIGFAKSWGMGGIEVVNLFAFRSTDPADLRRAVDPVGPENDRHIREAVAECPLVVCAWGSEGGFRGRDRAVLRLIREAGAEPMCLRLTGHGNPWHPLYLPAELRPFPFPTTEAIR